MTGEGKAGMTWGRRLAAAHDAVTHAGFVGAAACLAVIAAAYCYEVVLRYFFSSPTLWAGALVSYGLCFMVFLVMPALTRQKLHISISIFLDRLPRKHAARLMRVMCGVSAAACLFAAWFLGDATLSQLQQGIETISAWPVVKWPLSLVITYGMLSSSLYFLRQVVTGERDTSAEKSVA